MNLLFRRLRQHFRSKAHVVLLAIAFMGVAGTAIAADGDANQRFMQAMELVGRAERSYDPDENAKLLREAASVLDDIQRLYPQSGIAVQLATNQFIGDFDAYEFRNRLRDLVCNAPLSTACFLHRIEALLPPIEYPVTQPRWDWLSLAVAHDRLGDKSRVQDILAPFVIAARRGLLKDSDHPDLFAARALALTGEHDLALQITRQIEVCSPRLYNLADIADASLLRGEKVIAASTVQEAADYAAQKGCSRELGLIAQALVKVGREPEARTLFLNTLEHQLSRFGGTLEDCCPPELAVAAAELGDPDIALRMLRKVEDQSPWAIPVVLERLYSRGEVELATAYAEQVADVDARAEAYAVLTIEAVKGGKAENATELLSKLQILAQPDNITSKRAVVQTQLARAEKAIYRDDRWRSTFAKALAAAEESGSMSRGNVAVPLLAALLEIETGQLLLR